VKAEAAAEVLTPHHRFHPAFIFAPACGRILAHFPAVGINPDGAVQDGSCSGESALAWGGSAGWDGASLCGTCGFQKGDDGAAKFDRLVHGWRPLLECGLPSCEGISESCDVALRYGHICCHGSHLFSRERGMGRRRIIALVINQICHKACEEYGDPYVAVASH
jgi:hypothetical protein